ncbi:MAG: hypothetical protein IPJ90_07460 [Anaerolineaceae bacterium]|nr:hypothetical protein [Anaerolineaceae bacterium]
MNPEDADEDDIFNIEQAQISIGSGGWWGKGYLNGTQSQLAFACTAYGLYFFSGDRGDGAAVWFVGCCVIAGLYSMANFACCLANAGYGGQVYLCGHCHGDFLSNGRKHRHERAPGSRHRAYAPLCELRRQFPHHAVYWHWHRPICPHAPPQAGIWLRFLYKGTKGRRV